jgi:hypothetical protein
MHENIPPGYKKNYVYLFKTSLNLLSTDKSLILNIPADCDTGTAALHSQQSAAAHMWQPRINSNCYLNDTNFPRQSPTLSFELTY